MITIDSKSVLLPVIYFVAKSETIIIGAITVNIDSNMYVLLPRSIGKQSLAFKKKMITFLPLLLFLSDVVYAGKNFNKI